MAAPSELPFVRLVAVRRFLQPVDDVVEVGCFLLAQTAVLWVSAGGSSGSGGGRGYGLGDAEQAVYDASSWPAGARGAGELGLSVFVSVAEAGALQEALAFLRTTRSSLRGAVGLGAIAAVVSFATGLPGPRRGGSAFAGRRLDLFDKELSPNTGSVGTTNKTCEKRNKVRWIAAKLKPKA